MTNEVSIETASDRQMGDDEQKSARKRKCARIMTGVALVVYGLYHVAVQYYSALDSRLLAPSWNGFAALVSYESGKYESASRHWRRHYGMTYDLAPVDELEKTLEEQIHKEPERMAPYYILADLYFYQGKYIEAAETYQAALARKRSDYEAQVGLATSLAMRGDYRGSNTLFAKLFRQNYEGRNIASLLQVLFLLDRLEQPKDSNNAERYLTLANVNRYLRILDARREKAVISYADKALALDGRLDDAWFCKGVMFMKGGAYDQALSAFTRVVEINSGNADAYNRMGFIFGMTGNLAKELASYRRAVELESDDPHFAYRLGQLLQKKYGDFREAAFYFKKALDLNPADYDSISSNGYALMMSGEYDQALAVSAMMVERYPARSYGYKLRAECLMEKKQYEEAVEWYVRSREVAQQQGLESGLDFRAFCDLGLAYRKLKRPAEAIAAYRQALDLKPHDVNTLYTLQYLYRGQGRYEEAYAAVKEILRLQPNHSGARSLLPYLRSNVAVRDGG